MSTKDLNLSLDPVLLQTKPAPQAKAAVNPSAADHHEPDANKNSAKLGVNALSPWFTAITVAAANIIFLAGASYWLLHDSSLLGPPAPPVPAEVSPALALRLDEIDGKLKTLQVQMDHQLLATDKQQQIMLLTQQDLAKQLLLLTPDITIAPTTDEKPLPAAAWNVNLGSFQNKKEAIAVQQKVQAAGYQSTIKTLTVERITTHKLAIAGFVDQNSAEAAAKNLMDKIDLDSIWVWKDE
jgi:hypothetical protein